MYDLVVVGAGAAGFFAAIKVLEERGAKVLIIEQSKAVLGKVRISGGGRCNVTNGRLDPRELCRFYPRGEKELLGLFTRFGPKETISWFQDRGLPLYEQADRRLFPTTDSSQSVIDLFVTRFERFGGELLLGEGVKQVRALPLSENGGFDLTLKKSGSVISTKTLLLATGSHPSGHRFLESLGHEVIAPVPSIFTFCLPKSPLVELSGLSHELVRLRCSGDGFTKQEKKITSEGPLLATHWGVSGPAVLALSAFLARALSSQQYRATLHIDWLPKLSQEEIEQVICDQASLHLEQLGKVFSFSKRLWMLLLKQGIKDVDPKKKLAQVSGRDKKSLAVVLKDTTYRIEGKSTFKEEFVTAGGLDLKEVDMRRMESRKHKGLYFAGEILNIDGVTGGFNFQAAWTTGWHAAKAIAEQLS